jgi:tetratricopeptide (TPR) repeat protein
MGTIRAHEVAAKESFRRKRGSCTARSAARCGDRFVEIATVSGDGADQPTEASIGRSSQELFLPSINGPLRQVVERCLAYERSQRYADFGSLRKELDELHRRTTGRSVPIPQLRKKTAYSWNTKGASLASLGHHDEAIRCYDQSLQIDPQNAGPWCNKAFSLDSLGRYEEAIRCCDQSLRLVPKQHQAYGNKGLSLHNLGRYEEALRCYDQALQIDPQRVSAWHNKGVSLASLRRLQEAIRCFDKALEVDQQYLPSWSQKGSTLGSLGRYEEALCCFDRCLQIDPGRKDVWAHKALALLSLNHPTDAVFCCLAGLAIAPQDETDALLLGTQALAEASLGLHEQAAESMRKCAEISPSHAERLARLQHFPGFEL